MAAARPRRVRVRRVIGITNRSIIAIAAKMICRIEKGGMPSGEFSGTTLLTPVIVTLTVWVGVPDIGLTEQVAMFDAALPQATVTLPVNPPAPLISTLMLVFVPRLTVAVGGTVRLKSQTVPETATDCGLLLALFVIWMVPDVGPAVAVLGGASVTAKVHVPAGATEVPEQVSEPTAKFATVGAMALAPKTSAAVPVF